MAGGRERELRRRIRSVQSTKKITKAMELIAASRIVKAQQAVEAARPYSEQITEVIRNLASAGAGGESPLLQRREQVGTVATVAVAGDRGLCGAYNTSVLRTVERNMAAQEGEGRDTVLVTCGKKALNYFRFRGRDPFASFTGFSDNPAYEDARAVADAVTGPFEEGRFDRVDLVYTQFLSAGSQRVVTRQFLPLDTTVLEDADEGGLSADYEFEPDPDGILTRLLPRYAEARLFAALLNAAASEHAARQRAMKAATDNAEDLIVRLSRAMNRARQDAITTEIMEIVGGAEALRQASTEGMDLLPDDALMIKDILIDTMDRTARQPVPGRQPNQL